MAEDGSPGTPTIARLYKNMGACISDEEEVDVEEVDEQEVEEEVEKKEVEGEEVDRESGRKLYQEMSEEDKEALLQHESASSPKGRVGGEGTEGEQHEEGVGYATATVEETLLPQIHNRYRTVIDRPVIIPQQAWIDARTAHLASQASNAHLLYHASWSLHYSASNTFAHK